MSFVIRAPIKEAQIRESVKSQETATALNALEKAIAGEALKRQNDDQILTAEVNQFRADYDSQVALLNTQDAALNTLIEETAANLSESDTQILNALSSEVALREASEERMRNEYNGAIDAEKTARMQADEDLRVALLAAIGDSEAAQAITDGKLRAQIASETAIRNAALTEIREDLSNEAATRASEDARVLTAVNNEATARANADNALKAELTKAVSDEATERANEDTRVLKAVSDEAATRASEDARVLTAVNNETTARVNADNALKAELTGSITSEANARVAAVNSLRDEINSTLADNLNDFTKTKHGLVPVPPAGDTEQILTQNGWRPVTSATIYINELPSQFGTLTYNGTNQTATFQNYDSNKLTLSGTTNATNAGTYNVTFKPKDLYVWGSDNTQDAKNVQWKIEPLKLPKPTASTTQFDYTGSTINLNVNNYNSTYINIANGSVTSATNAGNYSVTYSLKSTSNTKWEDGTTGNVTINWAINQNALPEEFSSGFEQAAALTYNGSAQSVTIKNYSAEWHVLSGDVSKTNAGTYTAKVSPKSGYSWSGGGNAAKSVTWKIDPLKLTKPTAATTSFEYTGSTINLNVNNFDATYINQSNTSVTSAVNIGNYSVTYSLKDKTNTAWADGTTDNVVINWAITAAQLSEEFSSGFEQAAALTYNGANQSVAIKNYSADYHVLSGDLTKINAGTYTAKIAPKTGCTWADGSTAAKSVTWKIDPLKLTKPYADVLSFTYDGAAKNISVENYDSAYMTQSGTTSATNAGDYTVTYALKNKTNTAWADGTTDNVVINWAIGSQRLNKPAADTTTFTYSGDAKTLVVANYDATYINESGTKTATNAGDYTVTYSLKDVTKAKWSDGTTGNVVINWTIERAKLTATQSSIRVASSPYYNASEQTVSLTNFDSNYHEASGDLTKTDAGTYTVSISPKSNYCWSDGTFAPKQLNWSIVAKTLHLASFVQSYQYTGEPISFRGQPRFVTTNGGQMQLAKQLIDDGIIIATGLTEATNAGEYIVTYHLTNTNYVWEFPAPDYTKTYDDLSITHTIKPKALTETRSNLAQDGTLTYNAAPQTVTLTYYSADYHILSGDLTKTDAGTYNANVDVNPNYTWSDGSTDTKIVQWIINPLSLTKPTAEPLEFTFDGNEHCPTVTGYDTTYMTSSNVNVKQTAAASYQITINLKNTTSTRWDDGSTDTCVIDWSIGMTKLAVPYLAGNEFTFNANEQAPTINDYDSDTITISGTAAATNAGTYRIKLSLSDPEKTIWEDGTTADKTLTWKINRKPLSEALSTFAQSGELYFANALQSVVIANYDTNYHTKDNSTRKEAGDYVARVYVKANYAWNDGTTQYKLVPWTIKPITLDKPAADATSFIYNKKTQILTVTNFNTKFMTKSGTLTATDVGEYSVTYSLIDPESSSWADGTNADVIITWSINKLTFDKPAAANTVFTYGSNGRSLTVTGFDENYMTQSGTIAATDTGDYSITYALKDKDLYQWSDGTTDDFTINWTINPSRLLAGYDNLRLRTFTYDGKEKNIAASYATGNPSYIYLTLGNSGLGASVKWVAISGTLTATDAGTYTVTVSPQPNYAWADGSTSPRSYTWSILPCAIDEVEVDGDLTYNGVAQSPNLLNFVDSAMTLASTTTATPAGTYTLTVTPNDGYTWQDGTTDTKKVKWKIQRQPLPAEKLTSLTTSFSKPYTGSNIALTAAEVGVDSDYLSFANLVASTEIGSYKKARVSPKTNYCWNDGTTAIIYVYLTIYDPDEDSSLGVKLPIINGEAEFTYDGNPKTIDVIYNSNFSEVKTGYLSATDAGEYSVTYKLKGSGYTWKDGTTGDKTLTWKINRKPLTEKQSTFVGYTETFNGEPQTVVINNFNSNYHEKGGTYTATNAGTYTATVSLKSNYCWDDGTFDVKSVTWKIEKLEIKTPELEVSSFEYDGAAHTVNILPQLESIGKPDPTDTTWVNISGASATDVGTYTVTLSLKDKANTQWWMVPRYSQNVPSASSDVNLTWQITPVYLDKPTAPTEYTYTGAKINLQVTGYDSATMDVTGKTSATNVRDTPATATYSLKDKDNYRWADGSTDDVEINWKINRAKIPAANHNLYQSNALVYNGSVQQVQIANLNDTYHILTGGMYGYHYGSTSAGSYIAGVKPEPNYCWSDGTTGYKEIAWSISKAKRSYTLPSGFVSSFTLEKQGTGNFSIASDDPDICSVSINDSTFTLNAGKNGTTAITVTQEADTNYLAFSASFQVTIHRTLSEFSWAQIAQFTKAGTLLDYCAIGDTKDIFIDGSVINPTIYGNYGVVLIGYNHNADYEGTNRAHFLIGKMSGANIAFVGANYNTNASENNFKSAGWNEERQSAWFNCLPADLAAVITACKKYTAGANFSTLKIWLLYKPEIDGTNAKNAEQYEYFKNGNGLMRMAHNSGNFVYWWTRGATDTATQRFAVNTSGDFEGVAADYSLGIVPCFTIS